MMRKTVVFGAFFLQSALVGAEDHSHHDHHAMEAPKASDAPIRITINPEARVSVAMIGTLPPPAACRTVIELPVQIMNQGFVTAPLEAELVDHVPSNAKIDFGPEPLKGVPEETRTLRVTLTRPGPSDLTVSFKAKNEILDLGGRDRVHFLMQCK